VTNSQPQGGDARPSKPARVGVVIPYFQRQAGLLRRAVLSAAAQTAVTSSRASMTIAVVDDGSPLPADGELNDLALPLQVGVVSIKQANAGAAAARNAGLRLLQGKVDVTAFLDSDDAWVPDHIDRALRAFALGAEFYFCDAQREGEATSLNADAPAWFREALRPMPGDDGLVHFDGDRDLLVVNGLTPLPSIVHLAGRGVGAEFPERFFRFGEDQYYTLLTLQRMRGTVAYRPDVGVRCGRGVNIFAGNKPHSTERLACLLDEVAFRKTALARLQLSAPARAHLRAKRQAAEQMILKEGLWLARAGRLTWLAKSLLAQPALLLALPNAAGAILRERRR
jgi:succinoglycan biosynthesis protein ExoW